MHARPRPRVPGRAHLVNAVCPSILGMDGIKLALLLILVGGHGKAPKQPGVLSDTDEDLSLNTSTDTDACYAHKVRSACHMLLVGDTGRTIATSMSTVALLGLGV